jgi:hypothetical protein
MSPTIINITQYHRVHNQGPRVWFSIHFYQPIDVVKQLFDKRSPVNI